MGRIRQGKKKILKISKKDSSRKKHVETMFLSPRTKTYPYYFKPSSFKVEDELNLSGNYHKRKFYIFANWAGYMSIASLKSAARIIKWFLKAYNLEKKKKVTFRFFPFPDLVLTAKPKSVRMGKGKGQPKNKVALVKRFQVLITFTNKVRGGCILTDKLILILVKQVIQKLPGNNYLYFKRY